MNMLYESDNFVVVHDTLNVEPGKPAPEHVRNGFLFTDKTRNTTVFLHDEFAVPFQDQIARWQENTPDQSEVEEVIEGIMFLAHTPLRIH